MKSRLTSILNDSSYHTFVYEERGRLLGMIGFIFNVAYHTNDPHVRVIAFSVRESFQGKGIGNLLIERTEQWASRQGAKSIVLNSGDRDEKQRPSNLSSLGIPRKGHRIL
ncbi:GNAT family N-acetyltransferase [Halobacillus shinanisalinarum]|uniref:GNAT family N-acetyltransferase n=1 Tax=Halobacillus shinanisalinarum TaxID=2932258 RepID=A0ABY4GWV4_9BACI|nr:GNAT family N-acetyltransferase [Halobacillus shinanisalinarum]UOQ92539.1 GNAT family N-acetyltransferase [Halobacillus shinanisalinarum]